MPQTQNTKFKIKKKLKKIIFFSITFQYHFSASAKKIKQGRDWDHVATWQQNKKLEKNIIQFFVFLFLKLKILL